MNDAGNFERDIITGMLKGYSPKKVLVQFTQEYFTTKEMRAIYIISKEYYEKFGEMPDLDIIVNETAKRTTANADELTKMRMFIEKAMTSSMDEGKYVYAVEEMQKFYISRRLKDTIREALVYVEKGQPAQAQDYMLSNLIDLSTSGRDVVMIDFVDGFEERKKSLLRRAENPDILKEFCIPTGIPEIDEELDGGLRKGEFGLWLAAPEGGKSISLQNIAVNVALAGYNVALITIEMTPEQTAYRLDSSLTGIKYKGFRRAKITADELQHWADSVKRLPKNRLKIIGVPEGCTCRLIEAELQKIKGMFNPDIILVDYAGIMSPNEGKYQSSMDWKYVGEIVRNLKGLALKLNIPIWSASQLLVGSKEKESVSFGDIGLARQQIAAHADVCIAIVRTQQMIEMEQARLQFVKAREGVLKRIVDVITDFDKIRLSVTGKKEEEVVPF
jgi:replicative DNA helicase